jgi:hypothetical protein
LAFLVSIKALFESIDFSNYLFDLVIDVLLESRFDLLDGLTEPKRSEQALTYEPDDEDADRNPRVEILHSVNLLATADR